MLTHLILIIGLVWLLYRHFVATKSSPALSGPPRLPIVGHLHQIPVKQPWIKFAQWKNTYGDVIHLQVFGRRLVVLNSKEAAIDLFERRSAIYSERAQRPMAQLCGFSKALLFHKYDEVVRQTRKLMHAEISQHNAPQHYELQTRKVHQFVRRLLNGSPLDKEATRLAAGIILMISHGHEVRSFDDPFVNLSNNVMEYVNKVITPNMFWVDSLPFLRLVPEWFPGAGFQREASHCRNLLQKLMEEPFEVVKQQLKEGTALPSLVSKNLEGEGVMKTPTEEDLDVLMWTAGGMYAGGSHSTVASIRSFVLAILLNPEVQARGQSELDSVVGEGRLPAFPDRKSLPYVDCIVKEVLRWRPVAPLAAHSSLVDDVYEGQTITAGTVIMANAWAFTHDPDVFEEPDKFWPDRFLNEGTEDPRDLVFGFGRSCPGVYLVDNLLWIMIATILKTCDIFPKVDDNGKPIIPEPEYSSGATSQPPPFDCYFKPRFPDSMDLLTDGL